MKTSARFLIQIAMFASLTASAQNETTDFSDQAEPNDKTRQAMFNLQNPSAALTAGGAFYVSNPDLAYEIDAERAYLDSEFTLFYVRLKSGEDYQMPGRIRLVDQKVEVKVEGEVYELDSRAVQTVQDNNGRVFISGFDPVGRIKGVQWYEVAFTGKQYRMLIHESTAWQDPPQKNMFDTSEPRRTLKRVTRYYFISPGGSVEVDKMKDVLNNLRGKEADTAAQYVRKERLKNNKEDYLALLKHLDSN
ncbi:hypothetical protein GGR28_003240 [Lewinella aquimaris]|uniref:Uncharacterized protein n=1 Tax=Neolewinella aquimaris TaxID=1835722 RepID=A0A840EAM8_9BACT|nr:hypothetical protein [Neolewinella aquimaris]MBB4080605.1 hypothetical protein [Neolewinella aquimaris]